MEHVAPGSPASLEGLLTQQVLVEMALAEQRLAYQLRMEEPAQQVQAEHSPTE